MADTIPDLWGDAIVVHDLPPVIILNSQAAFLQEKSHGVIKAEIIKRTVGQVTELSFDIVGRVDGSRRRLLACRYIGEDVYPVWVISEALREPRTIGLVEAPAELNIPAETLAATRVAVGQDDFFELVASIFRSPYVRSKLSSIFAAINGADKPLEYLVDESKN